MSKSPPPDDFNEGLIRLLECPVCSEYMTNKIYICTNGHNVCAACKPKLGHCPTCRGELIETRCLFAESIAQRLFYPCVYSDYGCTEKLYLKDKRKHELKCSYRLHPCVFSEYGCQKKIKLEHKVEHEENCLFRLVKCKNYKEGCVEPVTLKDVKKHEKSCLFNICECINLERGCPEKYYYKDKTEHEESCVYRLIDCENIKEGCMYKMLLKDKDDHKSICPFRLYECVPCKPSGCKWKGRRQQLVKHMSEDHRIAIWRNKKNLGVWCDYDPSTDRMYAGLVTVYGELFWYNHKFDSKKGKCFWSVQYVGDREYCSKFKYDLTIYTEQKHGASASFLNVPVASDTIEIDKVYESECGVCVDACMLERYVVEKSMRIKFRIKKYKSNKSS